MTLVQWIYWNGVILPVSFVPKYSRCVKFVRWHETR